MLFQTPNAVTAVLVLQERNNCFKKRHNSLNDYYAFFGGIFLENQQLEKRYGLFTAICMVVGAVIGSGVFFKAQDILNYTGGNMLYGITAWIIGGTVMIFCVLSFADMASKNQKVNGVVDYAETTVGPYFAYSLGWYLSCMYYPTLTSVLSWVSARYTLVIFGHNDTSGGLCMTLAGLYMCLAFAVNTLSPAVAGRVQISTTVIKLIPLVFMAVAGTVLGLINGNTVEAFVSSAKQNASFESIFAAVTAASFAYEGWILATAINAELKNAKRNLPIALCVGAVIIITVYIAYFVGLVGDASVEVLRAEGAAAAFRNIFGVIGGNVLNSFIAISCLGTLNGTMLACTRGFYSLAVRGEGPKPQIFSRIDKITKMPVNSAVMALIISFMWLFFFYGAELSHKKLFGVFSFDSSELPVISIYGFYVPIFIVFALNIKKQHSFKKAVLPFLAVAASVFMVFAAFYAHGISAYKQAAQKGEFAFPVLFYLIFFAVIMLLGFALRGKKRS